MYVIIIIIISIIIIIIIITGGSWDHVLFSLQKDNSYIGTSFLIMTMQSLKNRWLETALSKSTLAVQ